MNELLLKILIYINIMKIFIYNNFNFYNKFSREQMFEECVYIEKYFYNNLINNTNFLVSSLENADVAFIPITPASHIYELGIDAFLSSPIIGVGLGVNASPWYSKKYQAGWAGSHSYHIDKLGQTGLVGIIIEWILMFMILKYMIKAYKQAPI